MCNAGETKEVIGTGDLLHNINLLVKCLEEQEIDGDELQVLSLDAKAPFPSLAGSEIRVIRHSVHRYHPVSQVGKVYARLDLDIKFVISETLTKA